MGGKIKAILRKVTAWGTLALAVIGGAALMATPGSWLVSFPIHLVSVALSWIPKVGSFLGPAFPVIVLAGGVLAVFIDLLDGEPNHVAVWAAITLPSAALAVSGRLSANIKHACQQLLAHVTPSAHQWVGVVGVGGVAAVAIALSLLAVRRGTVPRGQVI